MISTVLTKNRYIGGEPLVIPHLPKLIKYAHLKGLNTRLITNGILLTGDKYWEIKDYLNSVAFPFETCNDELNENIRGTKKHREIVSSKIKRIKDTSDMWVLVNTCVHRENLAELEKVGAYLRDLGAFGIRIDNEKNNQCFNTESIISATDSKIPIYVVTADIVFIGNESEDKYNLQLQFFR